MSQETPHQAMMDAQQLQKMNDALGADLRQMKKELERARLEQERIEKERADEKARVEALEKEREAERARIEELTRNWNSAKEEKKRGLSKIVEGQVRPFLQELKKDQDEGIVKSLSTFENEIIGKGLDNAFMNENEMASFTTIQAAASQMAATSSKLEEMFQSDKAWAEKYSNLQKERDDIKTKNEEALKAAQEEKALKDKMLEDLKKELESLKKIHAKNMMSTENLLEGEETSALETPDEPVQVPNSVPAESAATTTIPAVASNMPKFDGYGSLLGFNGYKARPDWRNTRRSGW